MIEQQRPSRTETLLGLLESDPENLRLLSDAADTAFAEGRLAQASALVDRYAAIATPPAGMINILGLTALEEGRVADAARIFQSLHESRPDDRGLIFNLAWALSRVGDFDQVVRLVDDDFALTNASAAALRLRALHHLGRLDEGLALGDRLEAQGVDDQDLMGALASLALDAEDVDRARRWAARAPETPDGQAALGMLALTQGQDELAEAAFEAGLSRRFDSARNLLGLGVVRLRKGDASAAAGALDDAAHVFGDHPGSWIAAGWAHFIAGETQRAAACFEKAQEADPAFAEGFGALAVVQLLQGDEEAAQRNAAVARRLDPESLGGTLAAMLLAQAAGREDLATRIREAALTFPVGPGGQTLAQAMAEMAVRPPPRDVGPSSN